MLLELAKNELLNMIARQLTSLFVFDHATEMELLSVSVDDALARCQTCFSQTPNKYYSREGETYFNPFHSGQYSIFLYYLSRSVFIRSGGSTTLEDRLYYLNKSLNGLDIFYEIEMPDTFYLDHPVGSVLGRATYGERFRFAQCCTVGNNHSHYPVIENDVTMFSGATIIGECEIGHHVYISANTYVKDFDIPAYSVVFGSSPNLIIKSRPREYFLKP